MATKKRKVIGYEAMRGSEFVSAEDALDYVMKRCGFAIVNDSAPDVEEFKQDVVDWFFSGPWVEVYEQ